MPLNRRALLVLLCASACAHRPSSVAHGPEYPPLSPRPLAAPLPSAIPAVVPSAPANAPASAPRSAVASFGSSPFGGDGALLVEETSTDGNWITLCKNKNASDGAGNVSNGARGELSWPDAQRYLVTPNAELAIDGWLSATPDGRFALVVQGGALLLWDAEARQTVDLSALGADARLSAESFAGLRVAAFDGKGERLLYARRSGNSTLVVVRNLLDGSEQTFDPGPGEVWRARFDPGGSFAVLQMITSDSNKNGRLDFPAPLLSAPRGCGANRQRYQTWVDRGDRPETVLLPMSGGAAIHEPDLLMPVLDALLLRDATGALVLVRAGKKRVLEPAECKGRIVHADAQRELFVVGCAQKKKTGRVSLELVTRDGRKPLNVELASVELDREVSDSPRLVALYPGSDSALLDADRRELIPLSPGDSVIATRAGRALLRRGKALVLYDADQRQEQPLPGELDKYPVILVAPPFAFVSPTLVNLDTATLIATVKQRPLALTQSGQLLVAGVEADSGTLARGPLRWLTPSP